MHSFFSRIEIPAGVTLAGYSSEKEKKTSVSGFLEVHGIGASQENKWELCSIDALYTGVLADVFSDSNNKKIIAASHTHFAPMIDNRKPALGIYSAEAAKWYKDAIIGAERVEVLPDNCSIFYSKIDIPIYRRFDFPQNFSNKLLTNYAGLYPNEAFPIDKNIYIFLFSKGLKHLFAFIYHACHPVTRANGAKASADYIDAIRATVREKFGIPVCLFLLGCAGDIRPYIAEKRVSLFPKCRLNWKFKNSPALEDEKAIDDSYRNAILNSKEAESFSITAQGFSVRQRKIEIDGFGALIIDELRIGECLTFTFLPFEVSHLYHLGTLKNQNRGRKFIVSCSGRTLGYLPHPTQLSFGGYEVNGSLPFMEIKEAVSVRKGYL